MGIQLHNQDIDSLNKKEWLTDNIVYRFLIYLSTKKNNKCTIKYKYKLRNFFFLKKQKIFFFS